MSINLNLPHVKRIHIPAHILGILSLIYFLLNPSWIIFISFLLFNIWFSAFGMSIGFHRYFSHRSFKVNKFWERFMLIGGSLANQGSVIFWVALHRMHHAYTDMDKDIHSPNKGLWHAYMGWIFNLNPNEVQIKRAVDWIKDPWCKFTHKHYNDLVNIWWFLWIVICIIYPIMIPIAIGMFIAGCWSIHQEAIINSFSHNINLGYRNYETKDTSVNLPLLSYLSWGQMLHNNHHGDPMNPDFGDKKHIDTGFQIIKIIRNRI